MELKPVTLISGKNNTGKTSILESVFLLHNYDNPEVFSTLLKVRGTGVRQMKISPQTIWEPLFYGMDTKKTLKINMGNKFSLCLERNNRYTLPNGLPNELNATLGTSSVNYALSYTLEKDDKVFKGDYVLVNKVALVGKTTNQQPIPITFIVYMGPNTIFDDISIAEWFGKVELHGKKERLIECLRILDESITDVTTIIIDGFVQLYITDKQNTKMPMHIMGDGIRKIMNVALILLANPSSVLLLDEIENGLHYSLHAKFWALIASLASKEKCQIIATTHSYECINGALEGFKEVELSDIFTYVRLDRDVESIKSKAFTSDMLEVALTSDLEGR
jgi:AAA15 family ATPase/GTPase